VLDTSELLKRKIQTSQQRDYNCNICEDTEFQEIVGENGVTAMKPCICRDKIRLDYINSMIPPKFQGAELSKLRPLVEKHVKQSILFEEVQNNPFNNYLLLGKHGAGKTWVGYALFKNAALSNRRAVALSLASLMGEFKRVEMGDTDSWKPQVTVGDLSQTHTKWTLFLDEVEKARVTEFTVEKFFELINAASSFGHQIIATSNMTEDALKSHFSKIDQVYGLAIMRRLTEGSTVMEMF
jgi:DNA replication protein DnaC